MKPEDYTLGMRIGLLRGLDRPMKVEGTDDYDLLVVCDCGFVQTYRLSDLNPSAEKPQNCGCVRKTAEKAIVTREKALKRTLPRE